MGIKKIHSALASALTLTAFTATGLFAATAYQNQVGYLTKGQKQMAVVGAESKDISFKDADGKEVLKVTAPKAETWVPAGDSAASLVDFSEIQTAGTYQAYLGDEKIGHPIIIADNALEEAAKASLKFFYFQRASIELTEEYAGIYARAAGHPDTAVKYHSSTGIENSDSTFNGAKGWYDAGDYGKYIVNSGISTYTLLQLYQQNKEYFDKLDLNIPESKNTVPDILDEIRWNLEWMLTMQDPTDGGVFHKLTTLKFSGTVMPEKDVAARYAIGKSVTAAWNLAAVAALAAEIYSPYDEEFAVKCATAASKARWWAMHNEAAYFEQPAGVNTGTYIDGYPIDEEIWANAELYRISKNPVFAEVFTRYPFKKFRWKLQSWQTTYALAAFTIATNPEIFDKDILDSARACIFTLADDVLASLENNGYGVPLIEDDFNWGSNSFAANKGMVLIHAYILTKEEKYLNAATAIIDYILGRNPLDLSYLTGYGVNSAKDPHHRPSQADGIEAPVPGMLVGGPNFTANDCAKKYVQKDAVAKSYYDNSCSYATNEVAINWNAPFAYVIGSLQAISSTGKAYDITTVPAKFLEVEGIKETRNIQKQVSVGSKLVIRNGAVQVKKTNREGKVQYFNIGGKRIR